MADVPSVLCTQNCSEFAEVLLFLTSVRILVFSTLLALPPLWLSCCFCLPSVTIDVGFPLANVVPSFFSC
jgi:hypothetical protein